MGQRDFDNRWADEVADEMAGVSVRLRQARRLRRMSMSRMADVLSVDHSYVSRIEGGTRRPSLPMLLAMSRVLDAPVEWLVSGRGVGPGEIDDVARAPHGARATRPDEV
jgi:transcriptional regulator with XRE-family HTH domain